MLFNLLEKLTQVRIRKRTILAIIGTALVPLNFAWGKLEEAPEIIRNFAWVAWLIIVIAVLAVFLVEVCLHIKELLKKSNDIEKNDEDGQELSLSKAIAEAVYETLLERELDEIFELDEEDGNGVEEEEEN